MGQDSSQRDETTRTTAPEKVVVEDPPPEPDYPRYLVEPGRPVRPSQSLSRVGGEGPRCLVGRAERGEVGRLLLGVPLVLRSSP